MRLALFRLDPWLLLGATALLGLGVLAVASSAAGAGRGLTLGDGPGLRQRRIGAAGLGALVAASSVDYHLLRRWSAALYAAAFVLLVAVLLAGDAAHGARRWLDLGPLSFQPSEAAKLVLVPALAAMLAARAPSGGSVAASAATAGALVLLVLVEPDTGTATVLALVWLAMVVAAGAPWRVLGALLAGGLGVAPLAFALAVPAYQRERIAVFLDPERDPLGSGFNVRQAEIAIGTGGITGSGILDAGARAESALTHVAARASDFVFAQLAEDLGLVGTLAVVVLFLLLAWRGYSVARGAPDEFGRLLAAGLTSMIVAQAAVHTAVNLRLFPATGITLPLVSAGGTSLLATCVAIGLIESVAAQRPPPGRFR